MRLRNNRHEAFAQALAQGLEPYDAYQAAGYTGSETTARAALWRLQKDPRIQERVAELRLPSDERMINEHVETILWVEERLVENAESCMQRVPVLDRQGNEVGERLVDVQAANRSLELLGKQRGMFRQQLEIGGIDKELSGKSDSEVRQMIEGLAAELGRDFIRQLAEAAGVLPKRGSDGLLPVVTKAKKTLLQ